MASILRQQGKLDKAEAEIFSFAEVNTPHQYWLAKSFILLADIYADKDDFFQAKATLQSVLDGYSNTTDGIIDEATNKLNELVKTEKDKQAASKSDTIEIKFKE
jgi:TolA-binding protein